MLSIPGRSIRLVTGIFLAIVFFPATTVSAEDGTALTIYSTARPGAISPEVYRPLPGVDSSRIRPWQVIPGYAIVRQDREIELPEPRSSVRVDDVAAYIEPTTVSFKSLTDPSGTQVVEQNFEFDLVNASRLLERFIDREISISQVRGDEVVELRGRLLSAAGGLVLQGEDGSVTVVREYEISSIALPRLPGGLITRPTLVWDVLTQVPGRHDVRVSYETKGMTWWSDYNVVFSEGEDANRGMLDIGSWVTIINQSGGTYRNARLKLIAGDVHRAEQPKSRSPRLRYEAMAAAGAGIGGFEEKSFFEYHLYTLGRTTTLPDRSTKQIELFPTARTVPCEKVLVYYGVPASYRAYGSPRTDRNFGVQSNAKVDIYLRFRNEEKIGLGMPLPSGRIRVSQRDDADGTLEFIGEDTIDHTPKNEEVLIKLGSAFDVVGERRQVDFSVDNRRDTMTETIEVKLRNHKEQPVKVIVKEHLYRWTNWRITESTTRHEKIDSRTAHFPVEIPVDGEVTVRYTVVYSW